MELQAKRAVLGFGGIGKVAGCGGRVLVAPEYWRGKTQRKLSYAAHRRAGRPGVGRDGRYAREGRIRMPSICRETRPYVNGEVSATRMVSIIDIMFLGG